MSIKRVALESVPSHLVLPAVRIRVKGWAPQLAVWCPVCEALHFHGDASPGPITGRAHHYVDDRFRYHPMGYTLLIVGHAGSARSAPRLNLDEALALQRVFNREPLPAAKRQ